MDLATIPMEELVTLLQMQLAHGGTANLVVSGNSMYPMLRHRRDSVTLVTVSQPLRKGDLILYRRENGTYVLHRIISTPRDDSFYCAGDNQWLREMVRTSQVLARVERFTRKGKQYAVSAASYRAYVWVSITLFPLRTPLIKLRRLAGKLLRALRIK